MYKLLLCVRYLRTRYIALASIISVTLGVATMIVVNSVMEGFSFEMQDRIHAILSDVVVESVSLSGVPDAPWHMDQIKDAVGDDIESMTAIVHVPAMLNFQVRGQWITRQVNLIGINEHEHGEVSDFGQYLQHPENREKLSFMLRESGYDVRDHEGGKEAKFRDGMQYAGWKHRRDKAAREKAYFEELERLDHRAPPAETENKTTGRPANPYLSAGAGRDDPAQAFDPAKQQRIGIVLGMALGSIRDRNGEDHFMILPGDDVKITVPTAGTPPKAVSETFTVVDFYQSKMNEYDSTFAFVPIRTLQDLRGMVDPASGIRNVTSVQIKLKEGSDLNAVRDKLRAVFPPMQYPITVSTWEDKQGPLLEAVKMEKMILNILLFLIIAVAGFGILATFFMIVVEKTRDIGILKSLGASGRGIMAIFIAYGVSLGTVGSLVGMGLGLLFVRYINEIAEMLGEVTGQEIFNPAIYFFHEIPTITHPLTILWIVVGAIAIAVLASVLPALRAAMLHPVEALRYE